jgi:predicted DNA-binding transcriptional regulator AlpA
MGETLLTIKDVEKRVGRKRPTIYRKIKAGDFPSPSKVGNSSYWAESVIDQYVDNIISGGKAA